MINQNDFFQEFELSNNVYNIQTADAFHAKFVNKYCTSEIIIWIIFQ